MNYPIANPDDTSNIQTYEEQYQGYDVVIEANPDSYRGGFSWSISHEDAVLESGLAFSLAGAMDEAKKYIKSCQ